MSEYLSLLTSRFAEIFQRTENLILISLDHHCALSFGAVSESAYLITVSGLESAFGQFMNVRHAALIQAEIKTLFAIPETKGVIKFVPVEEKNLATRGTTVKADIEKLEKAAKEDNPGIVKNVSRTLSKKLRTKHSTTPPPNLPVLPETTIHGTTEIASVPATNTGKKESLITKHTRTLRKFFSNP